VLNSAKGPTSYKMGSGLKRAIFWGNDGLMEAILGMEWAKERKNKNSNSWVWKRE